MVLPVNEQLYYFATTIAAGLFIGIMFDIYRIIRGFDSPGKLITIISDLLFWIFAAIITFVFFLYTNNVYLRYNSFIGLGLGLYLYFILISRSFMKILKWIVYYIIKFFRMLIVLITYPIKIIRYLFRVLAYEGKNISKAGYGKTKKIIKNFSFKHIKKKEKKNL
jgi:spore cortex biosynthesis protein YabQ